jgi:5-oxopent-3-ene-1,2,5-tricarboxylate decarboxylase/2-hydroxyhepta-2,4-diene-1,7-dioate isomerase
MKKVRFLQNGIEREGELLRDHIVADGENIQLDSIKWLPPCKPKNIIGLALNYPGHAKELSMQATEEIVLFMKPTSSLIGDGWNIIYPRGVKNMHYEGELAVVVGKKLRYSSRKDAMQGIAGYTIANDVTARDFITNFFRPPVKAKGFDTFLPLGRSLTTSDEISDPYSLEIVTRVNGEERQRGKTSEMVHKIDEILEYITSFMTLSEGDVILTGTPSGISTVKPGDKIEVSISSLGKLTNSVEAEKYDAAKGVQFI